MEEGFKLTELRIKELKKYKKIFKMSSSFVCSICSKTISNSLFLDHLNKCNEENKKIDHSINFTN